MTADQAISMLEERCEWCSFRQARKYEECVACPLEKWKQDFNVEYARLSIQK
jgi:hypothetical protein